MTFNDDEQVVLKAESGINAQTARSHTLGVKIMGFVSAVKAESLSEAEKLQVGLIDTGISRDFLRSTSSNGRAISASTSRTWTGRRPSWPRA